MAYDGTHGILEHTLIDLLENIEGFVSLAVSSQVYIWKNDTACIYLPNPISLHLRSSTTSSLSLSNLPNPLPDLSPCAMRLVPHPPQPHQRHHTRERDSGHHINPPDLADEKCRAAISGRRRCESEEIGTEKTADEGCGQEEHGQYGDGFHGGRIFAHFARHENVGLCVEVGG